MHVAIVPVLSRIAATGECADLGLSGSHPNPKGFRVWADGWSAGALVSVHFSTAVTLASYWGPVHPVIRNTSVHERSSVASTRERSSAASNEALLQRLRFSLRRESRGVRIRLNSTEPSWGFVLAEPFRGEWQIVCAKPSVSASTPSPAPSSAPSSVPTSTPTSASSFTPSSAPSSAPPPASAGVPSTAPSSVPPAHAADALNLTTSRHPTTEPVATASASALLRVQPEGRTGSGDTEGRASEDGMMARRRRRPGARKRRGRAAQKQQRAWQRPRHRQRSTRRGRN